MKRPTKRPTEQMCYTRRHWRQLRNLHRQIVAFGLMWLSCSAFTWPGRVSQLRHAAVRGSSEERVTALRLLEELAAQTGAEPFLAALEDDDSAVRAQAASAVGRIKETRGVANLLDLAAAHEPAERVAALHALGQLGVPEGLPALQRGMRDPAPAVQVAALQALEPFAASGALQLGDLAQGLGAESPEARLAAVSVLASIRPPPALPALLSQLSQRAHDKAALVRCAALRALGQIRDARALQELTTGLRDSDESVRLWAISAMGDSDLPGAVATLRSLVAGSDLRAAHAALAALSRMREPTALSAIAGALHRPPLASVSVEALITRAHSLNDAPTYHQSAEALQRAIDAASAASALDALAQGVISLASATDVHGPSARLAHAFEQGRGDPVSLADALITLGSPQLMPAALRRLGAAATKDTRGALEALERIVEAAPDTQALSQADRERLRQLLDAQQTQSLRLSRLDALLNAQTPPNSPTTQASLAELAAQLRSESHAVNLTSIDQLPQLLDATDPRVAQHAADALAQVGPETALTALSVRLSEGKPRPELAMQASAGILARHRGQPGGVTQLREPLLDQLQRFLNQPDPAQAMSALYALRASRDPRAAQWIAALLRGSSTSLRAAALQALGDFNTTEARRLLRETLRTDNGDNALNAALALGELGTDRDVEALQRVAERSVWPLPPAAAYAAARIVQRGLTRKHSLERVLCRFAQQRDPYVVANIASGLAAVGAQACSESVSPAALMSGTFPSAVRVAGARWLRNLPAIGAEALSRRAALLADCARDPEPAVAAACATAEPTPERSGNTLLRLRDASGAPLSATVLALRLSNSNVYIGRTDAVGQILLPRGAEAGLVLEDPADHADLALWPPTANGR